MLEDLKFVVLDYLVWLRRRTFIFAFVSFWIAVSPMWLATQYVSYLRGTGHFSDPLGSQTFSHFLSDFAKFMWASLVLKPNPASAEAIEASKNPGIRGSGDGIVVQLTEDYIEFQLPAGGPRDGKDLVGVIIIPGGHVSPFAYSPLARELARKGYATFILRLPFNLAFYGWDTAGVIIKRPQTASSPVAPNKWVLVGHSLGASGVSKFTNARPDCVDGVVYMGAPNGGLEANLKIPMLFIFASRDSFTQDAQGKPIKDAETYVVEGGNHRGFASYDTQSFDWKATIDRREQRRIVVEVLIDFIKRRVLS